MVDCRAEDLAAGKTAFLKTRRVDATQCIDHINLISELSVSSLQRLEHKVVRFVCVFPPINKSDDEGIEGDDPAQEIVVPRILDQEQKLSN